jgi:hypothetical protein
MYEWGSLVSWVQRVDLDLGVELSGEDSGSQRDWSSGDCVFGVFCPQKFTIML